MLSECQVFIRYLQSQMPFTSLLWISTRCDEDEAVRTWWESVAISPSSRLSMLLPMPIANTSTPLARSFRADLIVASGSVDLPSVITTAILFLPGIGLWKGPWWWWLLDTNILRFMMSNPKCVSDSPFSQCIFCTAWRTCAFVEYVSKKNSGLAPVEYWAAANPCVIKCDIKLIHNHGNEVFLVLKVISVLAPTAI